jgi:hypothetical protein
MTHYKPTHPDIVCIFADFTDNDRTKLFSVLSNFYEGETDSYLNLLTYCLHDNPDVWNECRNVIINNINENKDFLISSWNRNNEYNNEVVFYRIKEHYLNRYDNFGLIDYAVLSMYLNEEKTFPDISRDRIYELCHI